MRWRSCCCGGRSWGINLLVTGATGFLGRHLVRALVDTGRRPTLLAREPPERGPGGEDDGTVRWVRGDLRNPATPTAALAAVRPEVVFHLAGVRGQPGAAGQRECLEVNVLATARLVAAANAAGVRRVVLLGSAAEYGEQPGPWHEDLPLLAERPYGMSKAAATRLALDLHASAGLPVVILRPFTVYGPGQPAGMFVAEAMAAALGTAPYAIRDENHRVDLVYVADVVDALLRAASAPGAHGQVINIGSGQAVTLRHVAECVWKLAGSRAPLRLSPTRPPAPADPGPCADLTRARALLGWEPLTPLDNGLRSTLRQAA